MLGNKDNLEKEEKVSKKDSKPQSKEKVNLIVKIQGYIENNRKKVMTVSTVVVVATVLFFVIKGFVEKKSEENQKIASVSLSRILPYYTSNDYQRALFGDSLRTVRGQKIIGLVMIADEYGSTAQGKVAALYAGNCYLSMNQANESKKYFEMATGASSTLVKMGAYAGLGASYELQNNLSEAVKNYERASEIAETDDSKIRYTYYSALCNEKLGNKETAEKKYRQIIDESGFSEFSKYAKIGLTRLGMIIE